jgi:hypothetical protein
VRLSGSDRIDRGAEGDKPIMQEPQRGSKIHVSISGGLNILRKGCMLFSHKDGWKL